MKKKYFINVDEFINCNKKEYVYILGLLWADGNLYKNRISLENKEADFENLKTLFIQTGNWSISHRERILKKTQKYYKQCTFLVNDKKLSQFLSDNDYRIKSKTSPIKILSLIPDDLKHHFFRGYVDGDGSICHYYNCTGISNKFNITSNYKQNWDFILDIFKKINIDRYLINTYVRKSGKSSIISLNNQSDVVKMCDYLYDDSYNLRLERKYDIYTSIKNYKFKKVEKFKKWTNDEFIFLKENYHSKGAKYCSDNLNKSISCIYNTYYKIKNLNNIHSV